MRECVFRRRNPSHDRRLRANSALKVAQERVVMLIGALEYVQRTLVFSGTVIPAVMNYTA